MRYSKDIYDRDVLVKTAYCFSDRAYVHLDVEGNCYTVTIRSKQLDDHYDYENEFENELLAQQARKIVSVKTKNIRELIFMSNLREVNDDILKDWFEENE